MADKQPRQHDTPHVDVRAFRQTLPPTARAASEKADLEASLKEELAADFQIIQLLGRGSQGRIYLAREPALKRLVAIKVLAPELVEDQTARLRFQREAQSVAPMASHPNIVSVYSVGELKDGRPYIVMQYVKGRTMAERLQAEGRLPLDEALQVIGEIASALAEAHKNGVIHRSVKPQIILQEEETRRSYLMGFGVAGIVPTAVAEESSLHTQTGELLGTPAYMSPEQLLGQPVTERSDVYCLGLLAYELLTDRGPYEGSELQQLVAARLRDEPKKLSELRSDIDPGLSSLLERCVSRKPGYRPSAADVARRLALASRSAGSAAPSRPTQTGPSLWSRLLERRVPQVFALYAAAASGATAFIVMLASNRVFPQSTISLWLAFAIPGLAGALVIAWFHGQRGWQPIRPIEAWLLAGLAVVWLAASVMILGG